MRGGVPGCLQEKLETFLTGTSGRVWDLWFFAESNCIYFILSFIIYAYKFLEKVVEQ